MNKIDHYNEANKWLKQLESVINSRDKKMTPVNLLKENREK